MAQPVAEVRNNLGLIGTIKVNGAERKAKTAAATHLVKRTVEAAVDVAETQLETDVTTMKAAIIGRAVPVMGGLLDEVVVRTQHVRLGLQATEHRSVVAQIKSRHDAQTDFDALFAADQMTEAELAEAKAFAAQRAMEGCMRVVRDVDRAHDGLDAHLTRLIDHCKTIVKEDK